MHSRRERQRQPAVVSTLAVNGFPQDAVGRPLGPNRGKGALGDGR